MRKRYPLIGQRLKLNIGQGICLLCNQPKADARVHVQVNWFRGDDQIYKIHFRCIKDLTDAKLLSLIQARAR